MLFSLEVKMDRPRRKSTVRTKPLIDSGSESDDSDSVDGGRSKKRKKDNNEPRFRMNKDDDETFVRICVDHFDQINNTVTLKGTFTTKKQNELKEAWKKIAAKCNNEFKVSIKLIVSIHKMEKNIEFFYTKMCC